jgi:hypothetical protein
MMDIVTGISVLPLLAGFELLYAQRLLSQSLASKGLKQLPGETRRWFRYLLACTARYCW